MKTQQLDPNDITWPEVRMTSYFSDEAMAQFRDSMGAQGQVQPILVMETPDGLIGIDGYNRCMDAITRGQKGITANVTSGKEADIYLQNLATAFMRGKPKPTELIKVVAHLTKDLELDSEQIASRTGMTRDYVERLWTIAESDQEILQALDDDRLGITHAYLISRIPDPTVRINVLDQQLMYHWTVAQLTEHINRVRGVMQEAEGEPSYTAPVAPRPLVCGFCGTEERPENIAHPPVCPTCAGALHEAIRAGGDGLG